MVFVKFGGEWISSFRDNPLNPKLLNLEKGYMNRILGISLRFDVSYPSYDFCKVWWRMDKYFLR